MNVASAWIPNWFILERQLEIKDGGKHMVPVVLCGTMTTNFISTSPLQVKVNYVIIKTLLNQFICQQIPVEVSVRIMTK